MIFSIFVWFFSLFSNKDIKYVEFNINCPLDSNFCFIPAYFGSNIESFLIQLDTTTSYTWIPSPKFNFNVPKYNFSNSIKGKTTNKTIEIDNGGGVIYGKLSFDSLNIGNITLENFSFVLAYDYDDFNNYPNGKLGLGFAHDEKDNFNLIKKLKENNLINKEIFVIDRISKKLIIGKIPDYLKETPKTTFSLYSGNSLDEKFRHSWSCELHKIFCGIYETNLISISFNQNGDVILTAENSIDYDLSKDANSPAIFDTTYPYLLFPKKYLNYVKGNIILKFLEGLCEEKRDDDYIYFICDKKNINTDKNYLSFFIDKNMFFLEGEDIFKQREDGKYELLIRFPKNRYINTFIFGSPFLNKWIIAYDFEEKEISFYGENMVNLSWSYRKFKFFEYIMQVVLTIIELVLIFGIFAIIILSIRDGCCKTK